MTLIRLSGQFQDILVGSFLRFIEDICYITADILDKIKLDIHNYSESSRWCPQLLICQKIAIYLSAHAFFWKYWVCGLSFLAIYPNLFGWAHIQYNFFVKFIFVTFLRSSPQYKLDQRMLKLKLRFKVSGQG